MDKVKAGAFPVDFWQQELLVPQGLALQRLGALKTT